MEPSLYGHLWGALAWGRDILGPIIGHINEWHGGYCDVPEVLYRELAEAPVPDDQAQELATWLLLQHWSWGGKPVLRTEGGAWKTHGFSGVVAGRDWQDLRDGLQELPSLTCAEVVVGCCSVDSVAQLAIGPRDKVVIDPPYQGRSSGYGWDLPRPAVVAIAQAVDATGAQVVICEAEPVPIAGWHSVELGRPRGRGRTASAQQREWLTSNRPLLGQLGLLP